MEQYTPDINRVQQRLEKLTTFNSTPELRGVTRALFTPVEIEARNYVKEEMRKTGLVVTEDAIGNIYGTLVGSEPDLPPVWTGSHIDTVVNAGMYDGMVGVIGGLEAVAQIKERGIPHKRSIVVIVFTSEEPTRFGVGCIGSRAMANMLSLEDTKNLKDDDGKTLYELLNELGYDISKFGEIVKKKGDVYASVELHIEQGEVLERMGLPIGVVETISAPTDLHVKVTGKQSHAGSTPMDIRRDAFTATCEISLKLEELARASDSVNTVGTIGKLAMHPNASNVIPGEVDFSIDIRDSDFERKSHLLSELFAFMKEVEQNRDVKVEYTILSNDQPAFSDPKIVAVLEDACKEQQIPYHKMTSGAFHDSMMVAEFAPMAMIFVPSKDGISHNPDEYTSYEDIARGISVLTQCLATLANQN